MNACCGAAYYSPPAQLLSIPDGCAGKRATLKWMARLVQQYKKDPGIRDLALRLTQGLPSYDYVNEVASLHGFVRDEIRFVEDISSVETVQHPPYTIARAAGDCDDKTVLLCSLLESIGYKSQFIAMGFCGGELEHVMPSVFLGTRQVPLETVVPVNSAGPGSGLMGWMPPGARPIVRWKV